MKTELIYLRIVAAFLLAIVGWGFVAPPLVSAPYDIALILGVLICLGVPLGIYWLVKPIININKNKNTTNEK